MIVIWKYPRYVSYTSVIFAYLYETPREQYTFLLLVTSVSCLNSYILLRSSFVGGKQTMMWKNTCLYMCAWNIPMEGIIQNKL